jgi:dienelactone hydrolase
MINATLLLTLTWFSQQAWHNHPARLPNRPGTPAAVQNQSPVRTDSVDYIQIPTGNGLIRAAIATPTGPGPFTTVVILHGTHGFAQEYVHLARRLADNGMVGIAVCWFAGRRGAGVRFITPIDCPDAPAFVDASAVDRFRISRQTIDSLVRKLGTLSQVRAGQMVLFGHSLGGGAALDYILTHPGRVQGAVLNSTGYPTEVTKRVAAVQVPILMLHGTADGPADSGGGSALTSIDMARQFVKPSFNQAFSCSDS